MFYPDQPDALRRTIADLLHRAADMPRDHGEAAPGGPKAIIAPHAGYPYSGPVAASACNAIAQSRGCAAIRRVVLFGPAHRARFAGLGTSSATAFDTPFGPVPVDTEAVARLRTLPGVNDQDQAHAPEHGLEIHLPLLCETLRAPTPERGGGGPWRIVPLLFGEADEHLAARALQCVWGGEETLIVISSDLSHFHDYDTATRHDRQTADHILAGDHERIGVRDACGFIAIRGLMQLAQSHRLHPRLLDLRNSGDTAGPRGEVVGYGSFVYA